MVSTWKDYLGLSKVSGKTWRIGTYKHKWVQANHDEEGEIIVPDEFEGHKILGIADGEYLETDELLTSDYVDFSASQIQKAKTFCSASGWSDLADFERAFLRAVSELKPNIPLTKYVEFKGRPVLRTGYNTNPSYSGAAELGIFQAPTVTEIWAWDSEVGAECVVSISGNPDLKSLVNAVAKDERFVGPIDFESLQIKGMSQSDGVMLALAWDGDESSKAAAKLLTLFPAEYISKVLGKGGLSAVDMLQIGAQVLEIANELDVAIDDINRIFIPVSFDEEAVLKSMTDAVRRIAANQRRRETLYTTQIKPFSAAIEKMVVAFLKGKPKRYYPGSGYVVPPAGGTSLRKFLTDYAKKNKTLPTGKVTIIYDKGEFGSPRGSFDVDLDVLAKG